MYHISYFGIPYSNKSATVAYYTAEVVHQIILSSVTERFIARYVAESQPSQIPFCWSVELAEWNMFIIAAGFYAAPKSIYRFPPPGENDEWYGSPLIPEQFTVKAHPALFEGEGRGKKIEKHFPKASAWGIFVRWRFRSGPKSPISSAENSAFSREGRGGGGKERGGG